MRSALRRLARRGAFARSVLMLTALTLLIAVLNANFPTFWPVSVFTLPLVLASLWLGPRQLPWFVVFLLAVVALLVPRQEKLNAWIVVSIATLFVLGFIILLSSFRRTRLGVAGSTGESMLVDLRDRIQSQGELPDLPSGWYAESALRSAGGTPFAGDFVVASTTPDTTRLDVAVVDVSGKGIQAGTRSLLLSGAFGGLLGAMPRSEFLTAANDYLLRQQWVEGFATAVHLSLDLVTGDFEVRTAGHPPAVQLHAGSGRWIVHETEGPVLGLIEDAEFVVSRNNLRAGDTLLLYTDGLVEAPDRDMTTGIDKLLGQGDRLLQKGFEHGAKRLIETLGSTNDDRALLLIHRRG
ncbi:PP2C family protein-serine/threonine phosphatase [Nocardioides sp.]|uniref:PP2C family protein-serine/threonine phosphatase n=1 Tax=Nocardioides sp. TaxID=35761 RepID=UPI003D0FA30C